MHWVWETVAFWCILGYSLYSAKLCKATKTYQKYSKTSPYRSTAQSGARGIYHIVVLQECSALALQRETYPPENTKKTSKVHWCVICCPIQMAILGYSKTLFSAWNDWNKWKFTSTTNYEHVQMLIEIYKIIKDMIRHGQAPKDKARKCPKNV